MRWDRAIGGQFPSGDLPSRKRPIKPLMTNFLGRFRARDAMGQSSHRNMATLQVLDRLQTPEKEIEVAQVLPSAEFYWSSIKDAKKVLQTH